jgi:hypothetical protein
MSSSEFFIAAMLAIDSVGAVLIAKGLHDGAERYETMMKVAFVICLLGLLGQAFRNSVFLLTGESPSDVDMPLWALKDIGIALAFVALVRRKG